MWRCIRGCRAVGTAVYSFYTHVIIYNALSWSRCSPEALKTNKLRITEELKREEKETRNSDYAIVPRTRIFDRHKILNSAPFCRFIFIVIVVFFFFFFFFSFFSLLPPFLFALMHWNYHKYIALYEQHEHGGLVVQYSATSVLK